MSNITAEFFHPLLFLFPVRGNWGTKQHEAIYNSILSVWIVDDITTLKAQ